MLSVVACLMPARLFEPVRRKSAKCAAARSRSRPSDRCVVPPGVGEILRLRRETVDVAGGALELAARVFSLKNWSASLSAPLLSPSALSRSSCALNCSLRLDALNDLVAVEVAQGALRCGSCRAAAAPSPPRSPRDSGDREAADDRGDRARRAAASRGARCGALCAHRHRALTAAVRQKLARASLMSRMIRERPESVDAIRSAAYRLATVDRLLIADPSPGTASVALLMPSATLPTSLTRPRAGRSCRRAS
jgi:hypothetical protein